MGAIGAALTSTHSQGRRKWYSAVCSSHRFFLALRLQKELDWAKGSESCGAITRTCGQSQLQVQVNLTSNCCRLRLLRVLNNAVELWRFVGRTTCLQWRCAIMIASTVGMVGRPESARALRTITATCSWDKAGHKLPRSNNKWRSFCNWCIMITLTW